MKRSFTVALFSAFLAISLTLGCQSVSEEAQIQAAMENLLSKSPEDNRKFYKIPVPINWKLENLRGTTLATTTIYPDRVEIVFDWMEIRTKNSRLEFVIAHEISHAYDAFNKYGLEEFFKLVSSEKELPWAERTLEKSAIQQEDETRQYLRKNYPNEFW